ncbi:putative serine/threonine-protein kinase pbl16, partial [Quercus suber]
LLLGQRKLFHAALLTENLAPKKTPDAQELTVKIWWLPPDEVCTIALCDDAIVDRLERELSVLTNPDLGNHPNLVNLIGYCCEDQGSHYGVFYDVRSKDSLLNLIKKDDFTWTQRMQTALGVSGVIEHLHERNYPVCNPAHAILDQDSNPVFLDFSLRPDRTIVKRYPCTGIPLFSGNFGDAILRGDLIDEWDTIYRRNCWEEKNSNAENERMSFLPLSDHED